MAKRRLLLRFIELGLDCTNPVDEIIETLRNPAPGIIGIDVVVHSAELDGQDIVADVELDPRDYIRQCFAFGNGYDVLEPLAQLKAGGLPKEELAELVAWLQNDPDLLVTVIECEDGKFKTVTYRVQPDI